MNNHDLSEDTEAVLLLCGRFGGEKQDPFQPLSAREYGELAKWLLGRSLRPSDLVKSAGREALSDVHQSRLERKRIEFLLGRGTAMALALERWTRGGLWVISRGDPEFPKRLRRHLKHATPPLLYGAGDKTLLDLGGLAIIGSRDATESALEYTRTIAARCASEGMAVVSGGARGVDAAAMQGATEAGGSCIGVLANDLLKASVNRQNRVGLQEGRLVLVSPFFPEAGFNAGNAMGRNRYIYTLADQALVIDSALRSGGTWEGAIENLKHGWIPMYVRSPGEGAGNAALIAEGGLPFDYIPHSSGSLAEFFDRVVSEEGAPSDGFGEVQQPLLTPGPTVEAAPDDKKLEPAFEPEVRQDQTSAEVSSEEPAPVSALPLEAGAAAQPEAGEPTAAQAASNGEVQPAQSGVSTTLDPFDMYGDFSAKLVTLLAGAALSEEDIAMRLFIEKGQAKVWLKRACEAGLVVKQKKPVRYVLGRQGSLC